MGNNEKAKLTVLFMAKIPYKKLLIGDLSWKRFVRSVLCIYAFFAVYVYFRADSMIFMPQTASYQDNKDILKIPVSNTEKISVTYLPNPEAKYTILYSHGNASDLGDLRPTLDRLHKWGFSVLAYDYRGYGTSNGSPSEKNAYQDADVAYNYLTKELKTPSQQIIIYGQSVGGGAATELAAKHPVAGLILESTFTSAFRVVVPFPILPFDKFTNQDKLSKVRCPVLVMHGEADNIIPLQHGQRLYASAPEPKQSLWIPGAGHNDFMEVAGDRQRKALSSFERQININQRSRK
jgi:abhydrolase domain-containing protein 17